jgi:hypothetical protein
MRDVELYRQLLGIEVPGGVERVELSVTERKVDVVVVHGKGVLPDVEVQHGGDTVIWDG